MTSASVRPLPGIGGNPNRIILPLVCALAAGCGGGGDGAEAPTTLPACAKPATEIERPAGLPDDLPVPAGTAFTKREAPFEGQTVATGVAPGTLEDLADFYTRELEDAGYSTGGLEAEPGEKEGIFTGKGIRGGWRVNALQRCEGASRLTLVVIRA